jgi:PhzF family phenazine biosynthesis protein
MNLSIYQADAFAEELFRGNPAAVIPLNEWLPDKMMQNIALENNLSETAFFIPGDGCFHLRWFTPTTEVSLCGHATLATAHILFNHLGFKEDTIHFQTHSGTLSVTREGNLLYLNFPVSSLKSFPTPQGLTKGFGLRPLEVMVGNGYLLAVYKNESEIRTINPDFQVLVKIPYKGIIATAAGTRADFVSRFFAPLMGINEDPATGSAHTLLIPYWAHYLGKSVLLSHQISHRGGVLYCQMLDERVRIGGKAVTFMQGSINLSI